MVINHNMSAMFASRQLNLRAFDQTRDMEKLSSGEKINRAGDDASNLAVSEKMRAQIRGLNQAEKNIQNGVSLIQTTEGYLQETEDVLHRMRELSVQSANGIYSAEDREMIQVEVDQLIDEVNRVASHAEFNTMKLLTGDFAKTEAGGTKVMQFQVGANMDQNKRIFIGSMTAEALGLTQAGQKDGGVPTANVSIKDPEVANKSIGILDGALKIVNKQRADLGAFQNRFELAARGVAVASENMQAAESTIRDTDMANQMVSYVKNQILVQASNAMLAQANVKNQSVLQLLG